MPIDVSFSFDDLPDDFAADDATALDGNEVWFVYRTQGDDRVRPSHAALDGSVWRVDDPKAPSPPIDYGCRCFIEYCAAPDTTAAQVLPEAPAQPRTHAEVFADYLDDKLPAWEDLAAAAKEHPPAVRLAFLTASLRGQLVSSQALEVARMILETVVDG